MKLYRYQQKFTPEVQGTILYANQFSGIGQVGMPDDLAEVLNSNLGTIGNNVLGSTRS